LWAAVNTDVNRKVFNDPGHAHFLTFSCFHRRQFLTNDSIRLWLVDSIRFARERHAFSLWAYVFMPDHVHLLIHPTPEDYSMSKILRNIKEQPARKAIRLWRETSPSRLESMRARQGERQVHRLWQAGGGYDRNLYDPEAIVKAADYIEWNPVRKGYVENPHDWIWSSARARAGMDNVLLSVDPLLQFGA